MRTQKYKYIREMVLASDPSGVFPPKFGKAKRKRKPASSGKAANLKKRSKSKRRRFHPVKVEPGQIYQTKAWQPTGWQGRYAFISSAKPEECLREWLEFSRTDPDLELLGDKIADDEFREVVKNTYSLARHVTQLHPLWPNPPRCPVADVCLYDLGKQTCRKRWSAGAVRQFLRQTARWLLKNMNLEAAGTRPATPAFVWPLNWNYEVCPVKLTQNLEGVTVYIFNRIVGDLTELEVEAIRLLVDRYPRGLSKDQLGQGPQNTDERQIRHALSRLAKRSPWDLVLRMPGKKGAGGYRILCAPPPSSTIAHDPNSPKT